MVDFLSRRNKAHSRIKQTFFTATRIHAIPEDVNDYWELGNNGLVRWCADPTKTTNLVLARIGVVYYGLWYKGDSWYLVGCSKDQSQTGRDLKFFSEYRNRRRVDFYNHLNAFHKAKLDSHETILYWHRELNHMGYHAQLAALERGPLAAEYRSLYRKYLYAIQEVTGLVISYNLEYTHPTISWGYMVN